MRSNTAHLPIILRQEAAGAVLFDPAEGTFLELDAAGAATVAGFFRGRRFKPGSREAAFSALVKKEIRTGRKREIRYVHTMRAAAAAYPFRVLSAPTLADFQITNVCYMNCPHCYADSSPAGMHAGLEEIGLALSALKECGVCQVALGGGEPLLHPHLGEVLSLCHRNGIVPNLSTSGMHFTGKTLRLLRKYCGAVAVSMENTGARLSLWRKAGFENIRQALYLLKASGIPTVIQVVLSADNFPDLDDIADFCSAQKHLYGVIFLAFKPVGRGKTSGRPLSVLDAAVVSGKLQAVFHKLSGNMRVGYDCCLAPAVAAPGNAAGFIRADYLEGCSALRSSIGITPALDVLPCSFLKQTVLGNLKQDTLADIWYGSSAGAFRASLQNNITDKIACSVCSIKSDCLGGCPAMNLVNCSAGSMPGGCTQ